LQVTNETISAKSMTTALHTKQTKLWQKQNETKTHRRHNETLQ